MPCANPSPCCCSRYAISGGKSGSLKIDDVTGEVTVAKAGPFDFETGEQLTPNGTKPMQYSTGNRAGLRAAQEDVKIFERCRKNCVI